jgi:hypothetical protein
VLSARRASSVREVAASVPGFLAANLIGESVLCAVGIDHLENVFAELGQGCRVEAAGPIDEPGFGGVDHGAVGVVGEFVDGARDHAGLVKVDSAVGEGGSGGRAAMGQALSEQLGGFGRGR